MSEPITPSALNLASTDELTKELFNRFDNCVFAAQSSMNGKGDLFVGRTWHGEPIMCLGILSMVQYSIIRSMQDSRTDPPKEKI